jgi:WD40 repeat protein
MTNDYYFVVVSRSVRIEFPRSNSFGKQQNPSESDHGWQRDRTAICLHGARCPRFSPRRPLDGNSVMVYDLALKSVTGPAREHLAPVSSFSFDRDGKQLASGDSRGKVRIWTIANEVLP